MWGNTDQNNSKYGHFLQSVIDEIAVPLPISEAINKIQKYLLLPDNQLAENLILVFGL